MQPQLACLLLLSSTCVLCSDVSREQRPLEEELLRGLLAAQIKQKPSAPYWPTALVALCRTLSSRRPDASSYDDEEEDDEEEEEGVHGLMEENLQLREEMHQLQNLQRLCGALQGRGERRLHPESVDYLEENIDHQLKRKSPYILKRQTGRSSKSRRPYILKRSAAY